MKLKIFMAIAVLALLLSIGACTPESATVMTAEVNPGNGQYVICESDRTEYDCAGFRP
jgi:hypothetical protein